MGMFDGLVMFGHSIASFMTPTAIGYALVATLVGLIIGALPGLTATMGVALMTTMTLTLQPNDAILILICTYVGAIYGGSRSAILLNIPGTPASAASCLDGYALARQGLAGRAMGIATSGSVLGTWIGMLFLATLTPVLGEVALKFGAYEFFWLAMFGVVISGNLTGDDPLKGWIAGFVGLFIATIGQEGLYAHDRFTFGYHDLSGGIALLPALVGAFGFAEVLTVMRDKPREVILNSFDTVIPRIRDVLQYWRTIIRSGVIGTGIGIIPGVGEDVAAWSSYAAARRASKEKEKFGKGSVEGLMAAETGDNACVPGSVIPVLTLAVPGSAPAAVLLAAMLIHGVQPGPLIMINSPQFVFDVVAMMLIASIGILIYGLTLTNLLIKILQVPQTLVMPVIFVLCVVGSFALASRVFDIYVMLFFGIAGFLLRRLNYPMAPLVLGIVLGDLLDKNLRRGLVLSDGDLTPFFTRPISVVLFLLVAGTVLLNIPILHRAAVGLWTHASAPFRRMKSPDNPTSRRPHD
ncbi:tripartite tricarboxylate transporter permease [Mesorhizobium sp. AaZ16]|uniref:tripartite tricarboxylate transporter permease n=1 Tax=Mesorhizobium sp. AaZ16 TaxID=3402289 RepID=UPI00374F5449